MMRFRPHRETVVYNRGKGHMPSAICNTQMLYTTKNGYPLLSIRRRLLYTRKKYLVMNGYLEMNHCSLLSMKHRVMYIVKKCMLSAVCNTKHGK